MTPKMCLFKIQRTNEPILEVRGGLVAQATGSYYYVQIIQTTYGGFVLIIGDYCNDWQVTHQPSSYTGLLHLLRSFATEPTPPSVRSLINGWPDSPKIRQDLLDTVDSVLRDVGGQVERPEW
jgi:hypothetical protein